MADPITMSIELERLVELKKRLLEGQNPKVLFKGTGPEDIEEMRLEAEERKNMALHYAMVFVSDYVA